MKKLLSFILACAVMVTAFAGCSGGAGSSSKPEASTASSASNVDPASYLKGKNIRVVIGSTSVSGDTYLTADLLCRSINQKYGSNLKVDAIGAGRALQEIVKAKNENTIMIFHDMTYLGVLFGAYSEDQYKLENMTVGGSFAYNPGDCFAASASAPYKTIAEMGKWMSENPTKTVKLAVEAGGVSQIGFDAIYLWLKDTYGDKVAGNLKAFVTGSTQDKLQALWDGNCQGVYAATSAVEQYTKDGVKAQLKLNIIGLMAGKRLTGHDWPTFAEQGISLNGKPFEFTKEYFVFYGKKVPSEFVSAMDAAMKDICNSSDYISAMEKLGYKAQYQSSSEANSYIKHKRETYREIVKNAPDFNTLVG
ncbi:hypothetical protein EQM14_03535 [Caproiciproducens sp. NJN-50]|uniref:tripartite tricarboxylate transporter substrate-binding protein n=1 Tax=Acutalibacteraceae TaxID=3082771 RepID=UPI000FFE29BC|nr:MULTISPECIES: tripartite tricarboxylate transporter substrate-binding protein [Acutalibacteraceae]QAT48919.1 hypothetical protein EQM14_03535 [Caproiciproducens sp. NJN-50]